VSERFKRVFVAVALGLLVAIVLNRVDAELARLGIPPDSTLLDDVIVGLVAALCAYAWASVLWERHLRQSAAENLRQEGVLRERTRIACEIHDTVAQCFAGMIINLEAAEEFLKDSPEARKFSERALRTGREGLAEARLLVRGLRSPKYESENLRGAVTQLVERLIDGKRLRVNCSVEEMSGMLSPDTETQILRIIREALTNVVRHANASEACITLGLRGDRIYLRIQDDGRGFLPGQHRDGESFGLTSMRERTKSVGGLLSVYSQPGHGTQVVALIPVGTESIPGSQTCGVTIRFES
jgi:signal transduction histidine kinase